MRIKVLLSGTKQELPINNQDIVNSFIHRTLGKDNKYHNQKNNYSVSPMQGGKWVEGTSNISFTNGGYIIISSLDNEFINNILLCVYKNKFYEDIKVLGLEFIDEKFYNGWNHFATLSPFIIKEYKDKNTYSFITMNDADFELKVKNHLLLKLSKINPNLDFSEFEVKIERKQKDKVKKVLVKNVINIANQCQVSINCKKELAELIYNIGLGQSTGSGFGTVYKTENHSMYR
jgi:CRISPR-associated endoribonuclease Cas6